METLLKYSKYLEIDFVSNDPVYQSKMDLAISSLVTGDYIKAKSMFDSAIEIDSTFPSAWLGKAFSEIALVKDEDFNNLSIDEYLNRAMRSSNDILKYKVAIAGCLAYRHAIIIKKCVLAVEQALEAAKAAKNEKSKGITTAIVGSMFTGKDKSIGSNIVGGALIAGGLNHARNSNLQEKELELLGKSIYTSALSQTYLSTPIIKLCESLITEINDLQLKQNFEVVLDSWKDSVIYLYNKQREQLVQRLLKFDVSSAVNVQTVLINPNSIQEVGEFISFMNFIGLSNHQVFNLLDTLFKDTLPNYFDKPMSKENLEKSKVKQKNAIYIGIILFVIGIFYYFNQSGKAYGQEEMDSITKYSFIIDAIGISVGVILYRSAITDEMKNFKKVYKECIKNIQSVNISRNDFKF
jgi:hypothetical protein